MTKQELQEIGERSRTNYDDGQEACNDRDRLLDFIAQMADIKAVRQYTSTGCPCGGYSHVDGCLIDIASAAKVKS